MKNVAILFTIVMLGLSSCTRYNLISAEKTKVIPGIAKASPYFKYQLTVEVGKAEVEFKKLILGDNKEVVTFSVKNLSTNMEYSNSDSFEEGRYTLLYKSIGRTPETESKEVTLVLSVNGKEKRVTKELEITKDEKKR